MRFRFKANDKLRALKRRLEGARFTVWTTLKSVRLEVQYYWARIVVVQLLANLREGSDSRRIRRVGLRVLFNRSVQERFSDLFIAF